MSPASYRAAPPRVASPTVHALPTERRAAQECGRRRGVTGGTATAPRTRAFPRRPDPPPTVAAMARDGGTSAFAGEPQPVEVFHRGRWYAGDLLGWRHEDDGRCVARVRCVVGALR